MLFGYARVSTDDQNLDLQRAALKAIGCAKIFVDKITGTAHTHAGLARALKAAPSATCWWCGGSIGLAARSPT